MTGFLAIVVVAAVVGLVLGAAVTPPVGVIVGVVVAVCLLPLARRRNPDPPRDQG